MNTNIALLMGYGLQGRSALYDLLVNKNFTEIYVLDNRGMLIEDLKS